MIAQKRSLRERKPGKVQGEIKNFNIIIQQSIVRSCLLFMFVSFLPQLASKPPQSLDKASHHTLVQSIDCLFVFGIATIFSSPTTIIDPQKLVGCSVVKCRGGNLCCNQGLCLSSCRGLEWLLWCGREILILVGSGNVLLLWLRLGKCGGDRAATGPDQVLGFGRVFSNILLCDIGSL